MDPNTSEQTGDLACLIVALTVAVTTSILQPKKLILQHDSIVKKQIIYGDTKHSLIFNL